MTNAIIFVIDSDDREKFDQVDEELQKILDEQALQFCPILFLANKQDLNSALAPVELVEVLKLGKYKGREWSVQGTSGTNGLGLKEVIDWIRENSGKCGSCKSKVNMKLHCDCYICGDCAFKKYKGKLKLNRKIKFIFKKISVCGCYDNLTKQEFNYIFNNKKFEEERRDIIKFIGVVDEEEEEDEDDEKRKKLKEKELDDI